MPIVGLSTFEDNEILSAGKLNTLVQALESKFSALTADDFTWPMVVQGNIDFDQRHSIVNLQTFWNYVNAAEYDTLQLAIDAAVGGGCVIIPLDTVVPADSVDIEQSGVWIVGCGASSVLKLKSGASGGYHIRTGSGGLTDIGIMNLTMNGQNIAGQAGFQFRFTDGCTVKGVTFQNYAGAALTFTHAGTPGTQKCQNVEVSGDCRFEGGSGAHISGIDIDKGRFSHITSDGATATAALDFEPATAASFLRDISFDNIHVADTTGIGWQVLGQDTNPTVNFSRIRISDSTITGTTGVGLIAGTTTKVIRHLTVSNVSIPDILADAMHVCGDQGSVSDCYLYNAQDDGIDMLASKNVEVKDNNCESAGAYGIDCSATENCTIHDNNVVDSTSGGLLKLGATEPRCWDNAGDELGLGSTYVDIANYTASGGSATTVFTKTLPGNTLVKKGDSIRIRTTGDCNGSSTTGSGEVRIDGNNVNTFIFRGPSGETEWFSDVWVVLDADAGDLDGIGESQNRDTSDTPFVSMTQTGFAKDMTIDQDITVWLDPGDSNDATLEKIFIELHRGTN